MWNLSHKLSAKSACLARLLAISLMLLAAIATIPDDITSQGACLVVTPDDGGKLTDKKLHAGGLLTISPFAAIRVDFKGCTATNEEALIQGVFMFTDEAQMTTFGAQLKFFVGNDSGEQECPDTNGVGVDAVGGVFNCGLSGTWLEVRCVSATCPATLAVAQLRFWKLKVVSLGGTPYLYHGQEYAKND